MIPITVFLLLLHWPGSDTPPDLGRLLFEGLREVPEAAEFFPLDRLMNQEPQSARCLTPYMIMYGQYRDQVDPKIRRQIENLTDISEQQMETQISASGRFRILFERTGHHAVPTADENGSGIPDYVERAAEYADYSWQKQVGELGFEDPVTDTPFTIALRNIGAWTYGYTIREGPTTRIVVHNTFENFPPNTDPEGHQSGALKVTIAHELKHAIQFATNQWQGEAGSFDWVEMDATMMENIVYPQVNDYYNYITGTAGIFGNPLRPTPVAYSHVTWSLFFAEYLGMPYWVDTWREIRDEPLIPMIRAMRQTLPGHYKGVHRSNLHAARDTRQAKGHANDTSECGNEGNSRKDGNIGNDADRIFSDMTDRLFAELMVRNYLWHGASGERSIPGYGFSESEHYPNARMATTYLPVPDDFEENLVLQALSGTFSMFVPQPRHVGPIRVSLTRSHDNMVVGILGYHRDGAAREWISSGNGDTVDEHAPLNAAELDSFMLVVVNADPRQAASGWLRLEITTLPEVVTLDPPYPNPFVASGGTHVTVPFSIPERKQVTITLYDLTGRKLYRFFDREADPGFYEAPLDVAGLSGGVYIYRLRTNSANKTGKITLIGL